MSSETVTVLVVLANVMGICQLLPQVVHSHRHGDFSGVSGIWIGIGIILNCWWVSYALAVQRWGLVPVCAVAAVLYSLVAYQYASAVGRSGLRQLAIGIVGFGAIPLPFFLIGGWFMAGVIIGLCYTIQFAPAAIAACESDELTGLSAGMWTMALVEAAIWFVYGLQVRDYPLMVGGGGAVMMSAVILVCLVWYRQELVGVAKRGVDPSQSRGTLLTK